MAVLSTPSVFLNANDGMFNQSEAARYTSTLAETTLGNIVMNSTMLESGEFFGHKLWTISTLEAIGSLIMLGMVLRASSRMNHIVEEVDKSGVTMGDYTVIVQPSSEWTLYAGLKKQNEGQLLKDVEM